MPQKLLSPQTSSCSLLWTFMYVMKPESMLYVKAEFMAHESHDIVLFLASTASDALGMVGIYLFLHHSFCTTVLDSDFLPNLLHYKHFVDDPDWSHLFSDRLRKNLNQQICAILEAILVKTVYRHTAHATSRAVQRVVKAGLDDCHTNRYGFGDEDSVWGLWRGLKDEIMEPRNRLARRMVAAIWKADLVSSCSNAKVFPVLCLSGYELIQIL
ncbi:hypothetical protein VKT23_014667 [Stygiomarasmius scandens]|uniref:Uncharacterized protein n=1 Tax=Marasmiellus scandens TaxID=2682957 RepID=A0ABR1IZU0_9AGAR